MTLCHLSVPALKVSFFLSHLPLFRFFISPDPRSEPIRLQCIECLLSFSRSLAIVLEMLEITVEQLYQQRIILLLFSLAYTLGMTLVLFSAEVLALFKVWFLPWLNTWTSSLLAMSLIKYWIVSLLVWWFSWIYFPQDFLWTFCQIWHLLQTILQFMWSGSHRIMSLERCVMLQWTASLDLMTSTACHAEIIHPAEGKW